MDERLHRLVIDRLDADETLADDVAYLIMAACEGADELAQTLGGEVPATAAPGAAPDPVEPPAVYLRAVEVEGFRGIGPKARLEVEPGPGLTLVVGRNGSGKSSFAEGLELCLTGANRRWSERTSVWREGWRNLHHAEACRLRTDLCVDGVPGSVTVTRTWSGADGVEASSVSVSGHPDADGLARLGWAHALTAFRPFLSYNELGRMFDDRPSAFYDALAGILGLDDLQAVAACIKDERSAREKALKAARERVPVLVERLERVEDGRAQQSRAAIAAKSWDLDTVELALDGTVDSGDPDGERAALIGLAELRRQELDVTGDDLRAAAAERDAAAASDAGRAARVADLLERALAHHEHTGEVHCPVCGEGTLDPAWHEAAMQQVESLRAQAEAARRTEKAVGDLRQQVRRAMDPLPAVLAAAPGVGVDSSAASGTWAAWIAGDSIEDPRALADHLDERTPALDSALAALRESASAELERREDAWRPVARDVREWIALARPASDGAARVPDLKAAEAWLKGATDEVRSERFAPIADAATDHWVALRQNSSVQLTDIALAGAATQRRVEIDVEVDGVGSAALGVMSQGELCSLALCMFLPRATLDESPFRFVVIDDPVQSMDPAKVDGLARVLEAVANSRQVVVFTHDDRLTQAVRRLRIPGHILEVARRDGSRISISRALDPVEARLEDARAAARDTNLSPAIASRVVPGLCRQAIEAGCADCVRRRRLLAGEGHADVEQLLEGVTGLYEWVALALFNDGGNQSQGKVLTRLNNDPKYGSAMADAFVDCNKGAHGVHPGQLPDLVRDAGRLARALAESA